MAESERPLAPVRPVNLELVFFYPCPHCQREVPLIAPTSPSMAQCDACRKPFPIAPVDEKSVQYVRIILGNGKAAVDPDYL